MLREFYDTVSPVVKVTLWAMIGTLIILVVVFALMVGIWLGEEVILR